MSKITCYVHSAVKAASTAVFLTLPTVAENEYQEFLHKKQLLQSSYDGEQAELDGLIAEVEKYSSLLNNILAAEIEAKELVDSLPEQITELETKLSKISETEKLFSVAREM